MNDLEKAILAHRFLYYVNSSPIISDREYDIMESLLKKQNPNSPILDCIGSDNYGDYPESVREFAFEILNKSTG